MDEIHYIDHTVPKLLFKFKGTSGGNSLSRIYDILSEGRLFFPNRNQLNDPFEGLSNSIILPCWAGCSIRRISDEEYPMLADLRDQYRILALSATCFSPLMWANYGDDGRGICLCFRTNMSFNKAKLVQYMNERTSETDTEAFMEDTECAIKESFFLKHKDWQYEKEWRVVEKTKETYFPFRKDELVAIIFGHRIDKGNKQIIMNMLPDGVKKYYVHIGGQTGVIRLLPDGYHLEHDGRQPEFINTEDELYKSIVCSQSTLS